MRNNFGNIILRWRGIQEFLSRQWLLNSNHEKSITSLRYAFGSFAERIKKRNSFGEIAVNKRRRAETKFAFTQISCSALTHFTSGKAGCHCLTCGWVWLKTKDSWVRNPANQASRVDKLEEGKQKRRLADGPSAAMEGTRVGKMAAVPQRR